MAFPPRFLDELRDRVPLQDVVGRHVRLVRRGREFVGLSPFKPEKTPSFYVVPEKQFFHDFSSGEHGDCIDFVMKVEGLTFPEAVERLAAEAGLEVPKETPAERARAEKQASLHDVTEAAAVWFEEQLAAPGGAQAREYLAARGLDPATVKKFRLGFAPNARDALKVALIKRGLKEDQLVEAGLLKKPDAEPGRSGARFDYFRGRVMFPIADRRGRVIAFGARVLGDGQPKYLNSPDTPLFAKGRVLYGLATALKPAHDKGRAIVTEGYMDVIAMAKAGFAETVAPLGTALTESQIHELWRLAPEPILCFDGDDAGRRAAGRAAERALPLLEPGKSLRFVTLPAGEDPDSLIAKSGPKAVEDLLEAASPLDQVVWDMEVALQTPDTPERLAGLEKRLEARALSIADRLVQFGYRRAFRDRLWQLSSAAKRAAWAGGAKGPGGKWSGARPGMKGAPPPLNLPMEGRPADLPARQQQVLVATLIARPELIDEFFEELGMMAIENPELDRLRDQILMVYTDNSGDGAREFELDSEALKRQLMDLGFAGILKDLLGTAVSGVHAAFARPDNPLDAVRKGLRQTLSRRAEASRDAVQEAMRAFQDDPTDANWTRLETLKRLEQHDKEGEDAGAADVEDAPALAGTAARPG